MEIQRAIKNLKEIIDLSKEEIENNDQNITAILDITDLKSLAIVLTALEQRIINQKIYAEEYEKVTKQLNCEVKDNLEKAIALEQKDKEIAEERIKYISSNLNNTIKQRQKEDEQLNALNEGWKIELEQKDKEIQELKEKWDKDTHTLQNQLDLANADRVEKDRIIDLMVDFIDDIWTLDDEQEDCFIPREFSNIDDCIKKSCKVCIKQYFKEKASKENE